MSDVLDIDDLCDSIRASMYADDRQTRHELDTGLKALKDLAGEVECLRSDLSSALQLAFPGTHTERGPEDDDEVCDVCSHSAEDGKHTYRDCVANFESVNAQVNGYLSDENEKLAAELASARAQVELTEAERRYLDACYEAEEFERTHTVIRFDGGTAYDQARAIERRCADTWRQLLALRAREKAK